MACSITMKRPGNRRTPPTRLASASSRRHAIDGTVD
jgi:hypothetical protein